MTFEPKMFFEAVRDNDMDKLISCIEHSDYLEIQINFTADEAGFFDDEEAEFEFGSDNVLTYALWKEKYDFAEFLIDMADDIGLNLEFINEWGNCAWAVAVNLRYRKLFARIIRKVSDDHLEIYPECTYSTALTVATKEGWKEEAEYLQERHNIYESSN